MRFSVRPATSRFALRGLALLICSALALASWGCSGAAPPSAESTQPQYPGTNTTDTATGARYVFAVMGDSHTDGLDNGILEQAVVSATERGAEFIVHTGDVSNIGAPEEFRRYAEFTAAAGVPVYSVPGNHDIVLGGDTSLFAAGVGPPYWSFEHQGDNFVLLDNADKANGVGTEQLEWFAGALRSGDDSPRQFIFAHVPLGAVDAIPERLSDEPALVAGQRLLTEAAGHDNIAGYFFGHIHGYVSYRIEGVPAWVTGGAGAVTYPAGSIGYHHYLLVTVADGDVRVATVRL